MHNGKVVFKPVAATRYGHPVSVLTLEVTTDATNKTIFDVFIYGSYKGLDSIKEGDLVSVSGSIAIAKPRNAEGFAITIDAYQIDCPGFILSPNCTSLVESNQKVEESSQPTLEINSQTRNLLVPSDSLVSANPLPPIETKSDNYNQQQKPLQPSTQTPDLSLSPLGNASTMNSVVQAALNRVFPKTIRRT